MGGYDEGGGGGGASYGGDSGKSPKSEASFLSINVGNVSSRVDGTFVDISELNKDGGSLKLSCDDAGVSDKSLLMGGGSLDGGGLSIGSVSVGDDLFNGGDSCAKPFNAATGGSFIGNGGGDSPSLDSSK